MSDNIKIAEWGWKIFTLCMGVLVLPLAGWVWNTNVAMADIQNDLADAEEVIVVLEQKVEEAEKNSRAIISIEKDIEYMKDSLQRIEQLVTNQ